MQKTTHLHLNTWVETDPVDVSQISENFTLLDADAKAKNENDLQHASAIDTLALHAAHRALEAYHTGTLTGAADNLMLADFSKHDDWSAVSNVILEDGAVKVRGEYDGYQKTLEFVGVHFDEWVTVDEFEAMCTGNLDSIALYACIYSAPAEKKCINLRIRHGETVIATYEDIYKDNQPHFDACPVEVGEHYTIEATALNNYDTISVEGFFRVYMTPSEVQSGSVTSKEFTVTGKRLLIWLFATGTAPSVSALDHQGTAHTATLCSTEVATDVFGKTLTRYGYCVDDYAAQSARLRIQLQGQSNLYSVCGTAV